MFENAVSQSDVDAAATKQAETGPDAAIGPFQMDDDDLLVQLRAWFKEAAEAKVETVKKRRKDWKFYAGHQWDIDDATAYDKQKRPRLTLNMIKSIIAAVAGEERDNRQEMKFYGEGQEDDPAAYGINRLVKWIMDQCGGEFSLSAQFKAGSLAGEGWVVPDVDYFDDPNGKIKIEFVKDDEMFPDPLDNHPTAEKARYTNRVRMMTDQEGEARWPGFKEKVRQRCIESKVGPETDGSGYRDIYSTPNDTKSPKLYDAKKKLWAVIETWWWQIEPGYVVVDEATGLLVEKSPEEFDGMVQQRQQEQKDWLTSLMAPQAAPMAPPMAPAPGQPAPAAPGAPPAPPAQPPMMPGAAPQPVPVSPMPPAIQGTQRPVKRIYQAFHAFETLLDKQMAPMPRLKRFPYVPFRAIWDPEDEEFVGVVRDIIDAQKQHNVEQSVIVQLMQLMPKASWMGPKGSFHNKAEWQEKVAQPGAMLEYNATRGKPEQIQTPAIPRHLIDMASERPAMMQAISGVNTDMMGIRQASDAGVTMDMRKKSALTVLAEYFDNFRHTKMALGKVLLFYIQAYITPGRRIRVLGPEGATYVEMTEDMQLGDYDLTVDETQSSVNDRIATLNIMQTTLPAMAKAGVPIPPSIIDLMPMPPHIRDAWKLQMEWTMALNNQLPPQGWRPGMPVQQFLPAPPGAPPGAPGAPPQAAPLPGNNPPAPPPAHA